MLVAAVLHSQQPLGNTKICHDREAPYTCNRELLRSRTTTPVNCRTVKSSSETCKDCLPSCCIHSLYALRACNKGLSLVCVYLHISQGDPQLLHCPNPFENDAPSCKDLHQNHNLAGLQIAPLRHFIWPNALVLKCKTYEAIPALLRSPSLSDIVLK